MVAIPTRPLGSVLKVVPAAAVCPIAEFAMSGAAVRKNAALHNPQKGTETLGPGEDRRPSASWGQKSGGMGIAPSAANDPTCSDPT